MAFRDMSRRDRLMEIGRFHSDTPAFLAGKQVLKLLYEDWRTLAEGSCVTVTGMNGAGKSTVADDFLTEIAAETGGVAVRGNLEVGPSGDKLPPAWGVRLRTDKGFERPVIKVEIGPRPFFISLMTDYLLQLGVKAPAKATFGQLTVLAVHHSIEQKVRMVVFDESQEVVKNQAFHEAADVFRHLLNLARVQVVLMGMPQTEDIPNVNGAVGRRLREQHTIPAFDCVVDDVGSAYMRFCRDAEAILPFDRPSGLDRPLTALRMHLACEGYPGIYVPFLHGAAGNAIAQDLDSITNTVLAETYRRKMKAADHENPFMQDEPDPERFKVVLARLKARRAREDTVFPERRSAAVGRPDLTK